MTPRPDAIVSGLLLLPSFGKLYFSLMFCTLNCRASELRKCEGLQHVDNVLYVSQIASKKLALGVSKQYVAIQSRYTYEKIKQQI